MNIEKGIHTQWATIGALVALLPASRVFTGRAPAGTTKPYASIAVAAMPTEGRSQLGMFRTANIRIQHWVTKDNFDNGKAIQSAIEAGFENTDFALDDGTVHDVHHVDSTHLLEEDPTEPLWQFVTIFDCECREDRTN